LQGSNQATTVAEWEENDASSDWMAVAIYPKVVLDHFTTTSSSTSSLGWIRTFLNTLLKGYTLFYNASSSSSSNEEKKENDHFTPDATLFHPTFQVLYQQYETLGRERKLINDNDDEIDLYSWHQWCWKESCQNCILSRIQQMQTSTRSV
jgi:hypothetical protein